MKLLAIDGNSILNRAFYGVRGLSNSKGLPTNAVFGFVNVLMKMLKDTQPDCVAAAFDLKAPTFRHKLYDGYKATRHGMPDELAQQLPIAKKLLTLMGFPILECEGFEADDILGTLARLCREQGAECVVATGDRDSLQLIGGPVSVRLATNKEAIVYDEQRVMEQYGVTPPELIEVKALMGDSSDNIPGVKGIGEKTALSLISRYHTIEAVFADVDSLDATTRQKNLLKSEGAKQLAEMSKTLGRISTNAPIPADLQAYKQGQPDLAGLLALFDELEFKKMGDKLREQLDTPEAEPQPAPVSNHIAEADFSDVRKAIAAGQTLDFFFDGGLTICADGRVFLYRDDPARAFAELVSTCPLPKRTSDAKALYAAHPDLQGVRVSCELAAYLLDVLGKDYALPALQKQYLPDAQLPDCFPALCDKLERLLREQGMQKLSQEIELPLARVLASMERAGFAVDVGALKEFGGMLQTDINRLTSEICELAGESFNINSTKELGRILFDKLGLPTGKKTKTGYSTNADVLEKLVKHHPIAEKILAYRSLTKLESTYVTGLLKVISDDGRVHSVFKQTETRTGRISSTEPNMQNIPIRTELGSQMRRFFVARPGCLLLDADYSQIELRVLAHIAQDGRMIQAFREGEDIHTATAAEVFGFAPGLVPADLRRRAKTINFGIIYGMGAFSLAQDLHVSTAEAKEYIEKYFATYSGVERYMREIVQSAEREGVVRTMFGRVRPLPEIKAKNRNLKAFGERVARNTPIQGTAADIIKIAMVRVANRLQREKLDAQLILQVHDELLIEVSEQDADAAAAVLKQEMEGAVALDVPLLADVSRGRNWYDAKG